MASCRTRQDDCVSGALEVSVTSVKRVDRVGSGVAGAAGPLKSAVKLTNVMTAICLSAALFTEIAHLTVVVLVTICHHCGDKQGEMQ